MTPSHIPLKHLQVHRAKVQSKPGRAQELALINPTEQTSNAWSQSPALFDGEPEPSCVEQSAGFWTGVHWYRELHGSRSIETG
jgi:hypothetical protein